MSTDIGKRIRMERIMDRFTGNAVIVPMDHGLSMGPVNGLYDIIDTINNVADGGATAVVMHKGLVRYGYRSSGRDIGLIIHLSASTDIGTSENDKILTTTVEEAVKMGADAVSVQINLGSDSECDMLSDLGMVSDDCREWGMPLVAMAYPRGPKVTDPYDPSMIAHCARAASELGADIVKVSYTGNPDTFRDVVRGALAPVVIAGGPKIDSDIDMLTMVYDSLKVGGRGVSIGRNIFQHSDVRRMTKAITDIVLCGADVETAAENLK